MEKCKDDHRFCRESQGFEVISNRVEIEGPGDANDLTGE